MNKRDIFRLLYRGRFIIVAAGVICAIAAAWLSVTFGNNPTGDSAPSDFPPLPDTSGEYIQVAEALDEYAKNLGGEDFENVRRYYIAEIYADILNNQAARDMDSLIKTYEARAEKARAEAESLGALAWQARHSAETGAEADYAERMNDYTEKSLEAADKTFEAEYCENIIYLMTKEDVIPDPDAVEKTEADIEAAVTAIENITAAPPARPSVRIWAAAGLLIGMAGSAAALVLLGFVSLSQRLRRQKRAAENSRYKRVMDEVNFRG